MNSSLRPPQLPIRRPVLIIALFGVAVILLLATPMTGSPVAAQAVTDTMTAPPPLPTLIPILGRVPITASNATQVKQLMQIGDGNGGAVNVCRSPDGEMVGVATTVGLWLYNPLDWSKPPHLFGPNASVIACGWSPHGNFAVLNVLPDSNKAVWHTLILKFADRSVYKSFSDEVTVQWASDERHFATTDSNQHVDLWDVATDKYLYQLNNTRVLWSADGHFAALIDKFSAIRIWSSVINRLVFSDQSGWKNAVWSPTSHQLALLTTNGAIILAAVDSIKQQVTLSPFLTINRSVNTACNDLSWSPDGTSFAAAFDDGLLAIYGANGQIIQTYNFVQSILQVVWSPANKMITMLITYPANDPDVLPINTGYPPAYVKVIDTKTGNLLFDNSSEGLTTTSVAWSPMGHYLIRSYIPLPTGDPPPQLEIRSASDLSSVPVWGGRADCPLAWSPADSQFISIMQPYFYLSCGYNDSSDKTVNMTNLNLLSSDPKASFAIHKGAVEIPDVAWSPSGQYLSWRVNLTDGRLTWHITDGSLKDLTGTPLYFWGYDDHSFADAAAGIMDGIFINAQTSNKKCLQLVSALSQPPISMPNQMTFSPDMRFLALDDFMQIDVWQVNESLCDGTINSTTKAAYVLQGHTKQVNTVAYSPDGKILASGSADKTIRLWDVASGKTIRILSGHTESVNRVAFSPDGKFLVSASDDQTVKIWDVATGNLIKTLTGHTGAVMRVQWSPDGSLVASASADGTIKLWKVSTGSLLTTLTGHTTAINDISWSPDGKTIASAGADATIRLWGVP